MDSQRLSERESDKNGEFSDREGRRDVDRGRDRDYDRSRGDRFADRGRDRDYDRPRSDRFADRGRDREYDRSRDSDRFTDRERSGYGRNGEFPDRGGRRDFGYRGRGSYDAPRDSDRREPYNGYRDDDRRRPYGGYRDGDRFGSSKYRDDYGGFRDEYPRKRSRQLREDPAEPNETIGVFNLSYNLTPRDFDEYLNEKLAEFKGRFSTKLVLSAFTDRCRGYGFVHFDSIEDSIKAKAILENGEILGQPFRVAYSIQRRRPSESRDSFSSQDQPAESVQERN
ncbi:uncharacterized protein VICG_01751 [Vittaforma corneae ATCC 50505]|uniref:RRM domain-containing protein n=1 Tax=Vittaforma corneae (strain ATCC 50505) TaxID=993615 RepID=L2GLU6_VITCO|nr:uncharacterized protein VICG_01751 [Vittaforma corneae ATCC 50505]ELA41262.1 hypothetical protein VICG_01751 [Vittaforma corneae ATCC 50505]